MPSARTGIHSLLIVLIVAACNTVAVGADGAPAGAAPGASAAPARDGTVQQALRNLYIIPKTSAERTVPGESSSPLSGGWDNVRPPDPKGYVPPRHIPRFSPNLAAPRTARSSTDLQTVSGPDEDDMRSAGLGDRSSSGRDQDSAYSSGSIGGYRGFGQYGYGRRGYYDYRRSLRWPVYTREWNDPVYGSGREDVYSYGDSHAPGGYGGFGYGGYGYAPGAAGTADDDYRYATSRWGHDYSYFDYMGNARTDSVLRGSLTSRDRGLAAFRSGRYRDAADAFRLACESNQGDPAAQVYAGHALFAIGRYRDAAKYFRKAFELQPKIIYLTYDMRDDYRNQAEFDQQYAALEEALRLSPYDEDRLFVMGYVLYYGGHREKAYVPFARLVRANPRDNLAGRLMNACQPPDVAVMSPSAPRQP